MKDSTKLNFGFWNFNLDFWKGNSFRHDDANIFDTNVLIVDTSAMNPEFYYLSTKQKKTIRNHWINALSHLRNVEYLMTTHQIDQEFFDAVCQMPQLKGLYIKWGKIESIQNLQNLQNLKHLYFGSNPRIESLHGIEHLKNIEHLELENFRSINDFSKLGKLHSLKTLTIAGSVNSPATKMNDLYFLENLNNLEELVLGISLINKDTTPLHKYAKLERLFLPTLIEKKLFKEIDENK